MDGRYNVVIVGAGHAGAQAAITLRQRGFDGTIALVGDEPHLPYERPPLSKEYLAGEKPFERILLRPAEFWQDRAVALLSGRRVMTVDPAAHEARLADGATLSYDTLIWAAGGSPRHLTCDGHDLRGVHTVRTRADIDTLTDELPHVANAVVIGGGYIGLEAAAVLTKFGKAITLVEAQDRVLARVAGEPLSRFYEAEHRAHGVTMLLNATVDHLVGHDGSVDGVHLTDGTVLGCEMVIVGIGIQPVVAPLEAAGAIVDNGVVVDEWCRTSLPDVYAIGDCATQANPFAGGRILRVESVQNANDQAVTVADALVGAAPRKRAVPWFWSNQYDLKLQTVGLSIDYDQTVTRGDPVSRSFSVLYLKKGRVIAADCVNSVKDFVQARSLIEGGAPIDVHVASNESIPLKNSAHSITIG